MIICSFHLLQEKQTFVNWICTLHRPNDLFKFKIRVITQSYSSQAYGSLAGVRYIKTTTTLYIQLIFKIRGAGDLYLRKQSYYINISLHIIQYCIC